jgi:hypothetical protein
LSVALCCGLLNFVDFKASSSFTMQIYVYTSSLPNSKITFYLSQRRVRNHSTNKKPPG